MKKLAVRSLGWSVGAMACMQLPVLASPSMLAAIASSSLRPTASSRTVNSQTVNSQTINPAQLLAASLSSRRLSQGDRGQDVRLLQRYLRQNGLYDYPADGIYGAETADAVATYQRIRDLSATGIADEETLIDMEFDFLAETSTPIRVTSFSNNAPAALLAGNLTFGSSSSDVVALQQRLNGLGVPVFVDGQYGPQTEQAVRTYQRVQGLNVTGNADNETLRVMGFNVPEHSYVAAVLADEFQLSEVQFYFPEAFIDRSRQGQFINIGSFAERSPAEARVDAAAGRGFTTRVLFR